MFVRRLKLRAPQPLPTWIRRAMPDDAATAGGVTRIVAGPGYGKTVYAAQLFANAPEAKFWFSVDPGDVDPAVFGAHLAAMLAVDDARPGVAGALPALFVFDDVQALGDSAGARLLVEFARRRLAAGCRFAFVGRSLPGELAGIASKASVVVGAAALAFDEPTSRAYLKSAFPGADDVTVSRLASLAEGWPAGLALIASTPDAQRDDETRPLLFDYFSTEVLGEFAENERAFLLETSLLERLEPEVCEDVTQRSGAEELLASLASRGLFIARGEFGYSSHPILRDFLRETLSRTFAPDFVAELHRRAARALATRGDAAASIAHALAAGDASTAAERLEDSAFALLQGGRLDAVDAFLRDLGDARIARAPALLMARGRLEQLRGDFDAALGTLERAMAQAEERHAYDLVADGARFASTILASRGEFDRLLALLERVLSFGTALSETRRAALSATLGAVYLDTGRIDEALEVFRRVMPSLVASGDVAMQGVVLHNTGVAHVRRGEPYAGIADYERALACKRAANQRLSALLTLGNQIVALRLIGDLDEAERLLQEFAPEAADVGDAAMLASVAENEAALALGRGDIARAERSFRQAERRCDPGDVLVLPEMLHGLARSALALGNAAEAEDACARALALLRTTNREQQSAAILATRAESAIAQQAYPRALEMLREAGDACERGRDGVVEASTKLALALLYARLAGLVPGDEPDLDARARAAAAGAVALIYQRNYRFLLKTETKTFAALREHLRRWGIAADLLLADGATDASGMRVELLGDFRVFAAGKLLRPSVWKRRKARDIFAYLVAHRARSVPRARLVDAFWPEADADSAHDNLRVTISAIRKALGEVVKFEANGYRFVAPPGTFVDTDAFDAAIETAREAVASGATAAARTAYVAAGELYRGDFLSDLDEGAWQWRERERLRAACLEALRAVAYDESASEAARTRALDRLLEIAPFEIDAVRRRLDTIAARSVLSVALRDYDAWRERYRATIGSEPPSVWEPPRALATLP